MRLVIVIAGEIRLVGRDQRQPLGVGEIDQAGFDATLLVDAVALQFDIEAIAEQIRQPVAARGSQCGVIAMQRQRDRPIRTAGQRNQILRLALEPFELDMRGLMDRRFQERPRVQPHQAAIAALARRQQHDSRRRRRQRIARIGILVAEIDRKLQPDDRLDAVARHLVGEFQRPEHVVGIGQRQRRLAIGLGEFAELGDLDRTLQQRIGRMNVEMNESGAGHVALGLLASGKSAIVRPIEGIRNSLKSRADSRPDGDALAPRSPRGTHALRPPSGFSPSGALAQPPAQPFHSCGINCAQTAIIPTNSVIDASAAASSTNILNMADSPYRNI